MERLRGDGGGTVTDGYIFLIFLVATFVHGLTGFGFGLVSVPLLQMILEVHSIPPLVTLISALTIVLLALRYRQTVKVGSVLRLALASALIVPFGVYASQHLNERLFSLTVGLLLIGYSSYALWGLHLPEIRSPRWAYLFGGLSGLLGGLSNMGGPPLILYGNLCRWEPETFKSNLQGVFLLNLVAILLSRGLQGHFTPQIWSWFWAGVPAVLLGLGSGIWVAQRLDGTRFRKLVLRILIGLGGYLVIGAALG